MSSDDEKNSKAGLLPGGLVMFILNIIIVKSATQEQFQVLGLGDRWDFHHFMMWCAVGMIIAVLVLMWLGCVTVVSENDGCALLTVGLSGLCTVGLLVMLVLQYVKMGEMWHEDPKHTIFFYNDFWTQGVTNMTAYQPVSGSNLHAVSNSTSRQLVTAATAAVASNLRGSGDIISSRLRRLNSIASRTYQQLDSLLVRRLASSEKVQLASKWVYDMSDVVIRIYGFCLMFIPFILAVIASCLGSGWCCGKLCSSK